MPKVIRCSICGRLCGDIPHNAMPYKQGYACDQCHQTHVIPSKKWKENRFNWYANRR